MKELIKQYLDRGISRRGFLSGLAAFGMSSAAAKTMARSLSPFSVAAEEANTEAAPSWMRPMRGNGGSLLVAQLKAAGVEYIFFNPSSGEAPIFDALVDEPNIHLIKVLQEGALAAMADGYAKASRKTPFLLVARPGLPNAMTQMFNSWKDQIPMVVSVGFSRIDTLGQDGFENTDHIEDMSAPITKWHWVAEKTEKIPEITRRAFKFASTTPCGPVFVGYPDDTLSRETDAMIMNQEKFSVPMNIHPDPAAVERAARLLLEAQNPLLYAGDEVVWSGAQHEVLELAELLGMPAAQPPGSVAWSRAFPTRHPLFLGDYRQQMRYPGRVDVMLNLGGRMPNPGARLKIFPDVKLIQVRMDVTNLARNYPTEVPIVADLKHAAADLADAVRSIATASRLQKIRETRRANSEEYTAKMRAFRRQIVRDKWNASSISEGRLGMEMELALEKDTCLIAEVGSASPITRQMHFGGSDKQFFGNSGKALGWALPASFGVKLAFPDRPVVAVMGDGAFSFAGPQPLWTFARYHAPVTLIVVNNGSYNAERNRMLMKGGRMFQTGRDMACSLGNPDIDHAKAAAAYGVEGEVVRDASNLGPALERAKRATAQGSPYLLDVHVERRGIGAASNWHPPFSIEALRQRRV